MTTALPLEECCQRPKSAKLAGSCYRMSMLRQMLTDRIRLAHHGGNDRRRA
jgi:hypothetical protein